MTLNNRHKKLLYRSSHRGLKETDVLLGEFAKTQITVLTDYELSAFESLLDESDNDLMNWLFEREKIPQGKYKCIIHKIISYRKSF